MANWAHVFLDTRSEGTVTRTPSRPAHTQVLSFCVFSSVTSLSFDLSRGWGGTISQPLGHPKLWLPCLPSRHTAHQDSSSLFLPSLPRRPGAPYSLLSNPGPSTLSHRVTHIHIDTPTHTHTHTHTLINTHSHSHINTHTCSRLTHICTFTHSHTLLHTITRNHTASLVAQMVKKSTYYAGDLGSIPGLGRSPGGEHDNPLQYPCLENLHGQRGLAGYSPWGHKESDTTE